jgi:protein gp37
VNFRKVTPLMDAFNSSPQGWHDWLRKRLHWVIIGGESGPGARPMHPDWVKDLRNQCTTAGVPVFFKQWGDWVPVSEVAGKGDHHHFEDGCTLRNVGKKKAGRMLYGREWSQLPTTK